MIVSQFQAWARTAPAPMRADGVSALARAYLYSDLSPDQSRATVRTLTNFLDDPSPLVRRALADALASAAEAPHHIVAALAEDQPGIAAIVLSRSPVFSDAELIDFLTQGGAAAQGAVAARPWLSQAVAEALAAIGDASALVTLAGNFGADLSLPAIKRMVARHGGHSPLREALLARGHLPATVRVDLVAATAAALAALVSGRDWMSGERAKRVTREAAERATVAIASCDGLDPGELDALAAELRASGQLTVAFALRTLLSDNRPLFRALLAELSGTPGDRVGGLLRQPASAGFAALYRKAGLPSPLLPVFRAVLAAAGAPAGERSGAGLSPRLVDLALRACAADGEGALDKLAVLLRRFETEARRDDARAGAARPAASRSAFSAAPSPLPALALVNGPPANDPVLAEAGRLAAVTFDEAVPRQRAGSLPPQQPPRLTIDLAAIEAELLAA